MDVPPPGQQSAASLERKPLPDLDHMQLERRADALLAPWAGTTGPGVTLGVVRDGALVLHRSAGLASVEHRVPIGPGTRFRIASVSKQFTTAAILLLAHEGRLNLEDDARTYIPELTDFGHTLTVAHLMHNTSGLRDMLEIMRQGGADLGTPIPAQALLDGIARQRTLNFTPGTRFLYSNSNFLLLGLIVERLAGQKLETFLEQRIFAPLGMTRTLMTPDVHVAVPDLATGYRRAGEAWARAPHAFPLHGEGGLVSCVEDLALWDRNLDTGRVGGDWLAGALAQQVPFTNGAENRYASGQVVRGHRGLRTVSHGGLWPGYRTEFLRVPSLHATVIAISNSAAADPNLLAHQVLDLMLEGRPGIHPVPPWPERAALETLAGRYLDPAGSATLDIAVPESGAPTLASNGLTAAAEPLADGRLATPRGSSVFAVRAAGPDAVEVEQDAGAISVWGRVAPGAAMPEGLPGAYRSPEMDATWTVTADAAGAHHVVARGPAAVGQPWPVEPIQGDVIRVHVPGTLWPAWLDVRVTRRGDGAVTGLLVNGGRARGVRYARE